MSNRTLACTGPQERLVIDLMGAGYSKTLFQQLCSSKQYSVHLLRLQDICQTCIRH